MTNVNDTTTFKVSCTDMVDGIGLELYIDDSQQ